ncbi:hypothetical protein ACRAQ7_11020 [Erythrobacter sp. W53]|uniref:hypothetical protein n=1 Tax=Erythrobacter sp. W53 TaxID=3425947 RepID=UPI003D767053
MKPATYDPTIKFGPSAELGYPLSRINGTALSPHGDPATREHMNRWEHHVATGQIGSGLPKTDPKILARLVRNELVLLGRR